MRFGKCQSWMVDPNIRKNLPEISTTIRCRWQVIWVNKPIFSEYYQSWKNICRQMVGLVKLLSQMLQDPSMPVFNLWNLSAVRNSEDSLLPYRNNNWKEASVRSETVSCQSITILDYLLNTHIKVAIQASIRMQRHSCDSGGCQYCAFLRKSYLCYFTFYCRTFLFFILANGVRKRLTAGKRVWAWNDWLLPPHDGDRWMCVCPHRSTLVVRPL